jgi:predicted ribonuclease YlaK
MRRLLDGKGRGPADVRAGVTLEVRLTRSGHLRHQNNDEEILANVESLSRRPGGPLVLATDDLAMQLRAESRGMDVVAIPENLSMPLEPPPSDES